MDPSFGVDDVLVGPQTWSVLIRRGLRRRCARCGGGEVFVTRWRLKDRCPTCGYLFRREPGFFLGAWFINFMVLELLHFAMVMTFIVWKSANPEGGLVLPLGAAVLTAFLVPVAFYPWSQTIWAGIDLAMTPLELDEIVGAADAMEAEHGRTSE